MEPESLGTAGFCIFCGSRKQLTKEHVVPWSIAGPWVYYKATCRPCADKFVAFEQPILSRYLLPIRAKLDLPTGNPAKRPTEYDVGLEMPDGSRKAVRVPTKDFPATVMFPELAPPGILDPARRPDQAVFTGITGAVLDRGAMERLVSIHGAKGLAGEHGLVPDHFLRMIGKIAYAFAISQIGMENMLNAPVLASIRGDRNDIALWVGGGADVPPAPDGMVHHLRVLVVEPHGGIRVDVRLFAPLGGPAYSVLVGHAKPGFKLDGQKRFITRDVFRVEWEEPETMLHWKLKTDLRPTPATTSPSA